MRRSPIIFAVLLLLIWAAGLSPQSPSASHPQLILFISVDQMRFDYLTRFSSLYTAGFKTLLDRGAVFSEAFYRHAETETGPGHAVMLSGRHPSSNGIIANSWYDPKIKDEVNVVDDAAQKTVGGPGRGASPAHFVGLHFSTAFKEKWPDARVIGVSIKDRAAILTSGPKADAAFWFENGCGCFVTSSYYMKMPPAWLVQFNQRHVADSYAGTPWTRLLPEEASYLKLSSEDNFPGEWDLKDTVFPHAHRGHPPQAVYYDDLRRTPFADDLLLQADLAVLDAYEMGKHPSPDLLVTSFSASDYIGHTYGAFSQEAMDEYLRLDLVLGKLLDAVDKRVGLDHTLLVLTGDHGSLPLVEWLQKQGKPARRIAPAILEKAVRDAFQAQFPTAGELILDFRSPHFYLDRFAMGRQGLSPAEVERAAVQALLSTGVVARVYTREQLSGKKPVSAAGTNGSADPYIGFFRNSFYPSRSPDLLVLPKEYYYVSDYPGGTGHGTPYDYDRHVPVVFMGPGIKSGRYTAPAGPEDIAPTLARLVGMTYPLEPDSRLLNEVLP